jgi:hypothetical protein
MANFQGYVAKALRKEGTQRNGKAWFKFNVKLALDSGQESPWISFPFNKSIPFAEGQYVSFDAVADEKGYFNVVEGTGAILTPPAAAAAPAAAANDAAKGTAPTAYQEAQAQKDVRISFQAARNSAIEVVGLLLANDALPLLGTKGKAAEAKRFEEVLDIVNKLTVQFHNDAQTLRLLESVADAGSIDVESETPEPVQVSETPQQAASHNPHPNSQPAPLVSDSLDAPAKF